MTYGQIRVLAQKIVRRRSTDLQNMASAMRVAQHGKRSAFNRFIDSLYRGEEDDGHVLTKDELRGDFDFVDQAEGGKD